MKILIVIPFLLIVTLVDCYPQRFDYKDVPKIAQEYYETAQTQRKSIYEKLQLEAIEIVTYLPRNYSKRGDVDYTVYLQQGINQNRKVILPDFPILINPSGLKLKSNSVIYFQENTQLIIQPNALERYQALLVEDVQNVEIYYPNIVGDKDKHLSNKGQWGMGVHINNAKDINVFAPKIINCWGDGLYIGSRGGKISENIVVESGFFDNNRRNGISIIAGKNITVKNTSLGNTIGHNPQSGIDIEPNSNRDLLVNIKLENIITYNNPWNGIIVSVGKLVGKEKKDISLTIKNHTDIGSHIGFAIAFTRADNENNYKRLTGEISLDRGTYINNKFFIRNYNTKETSISVKTTHIEMFRDGDRVNNKDNIDKFLNTINKSHQSIK